MKWPPLFGLLLTIVLLFVAMTMGGPFLIFINVSSMILVPCVTALLLVCMHGWTDVSTYVVGGYRRIFMVTDGIPWGEKQCRKAVRLANSGGSLCLMAGGLAVMVGVITVAQNLDDPTAIGPSAALALLSALYTFLLNLLLFVPLSRHYAEQVLERVEA